MAQDRLLGSCPNCSNSIEAVQVWTPGGINDKGGWILACDQCGAKFDFYVGKDISDSRLVSGAKVVETYDVEVEERESVLKRHGLPV